MPHERERSIRSTHVDGITAIVTSGGSGLGGVTTAMPASGVAMILDAVGDEFRFPQIRRAA